MTKEYWWLILIFIIAALFRFIYFTSVPPGLYPDEAMDGTNAQEILHTGVFKVFYPENNGREGLFINIQAILLSLIHQNQPWVLRLPSAVFGLLTVVGLYFLAKELFKSTAMGLLSSFFIAVNYWHITFSRISFRAIMAPFFLVWGLYLLLLSLHKAGVFADIQEEFKIQNSKFKITIQNLKFIIPAILGGIIYGLGFYSYIAYRVTPLIVLIVLVYFFMKSKKQNWIKNFWVITTAFLLTAFLAALPLGVYFLKNPADFFGRTSELSVFKTASPALALTTNILKTAGMFTVAGDYNWRHNYAGQPELLAIVGVIFLIGLALGIVRLFKKDFSFAVIFGWIFAAGLPVVISNEGIPHALRSILLIPPVIMLAAYGGIVFYRWTKQVLGIANGRLFTSALLILALVGVETYMVFFGLWAKNPHTADAFSSDYAEIGREINALPNTAVKIVLVNASGVNVPTPPAHQLPGPPMPTQTVMYLTDTFYGTEKIGNGIYYNKDKNITYYVMPEAADAVKLLNLPPSIHVYSLN
jgi:4-amino-4-deoxy-L-arabinose transferase-like glycosyltransferase